MTAALPAPLVLERPAVDALAWQADGACREQDPELFYATPGDFVTHAAKAVCKRSCPVMDQCLTWALDKDERWGVWGGTDERERATIRRRAQRAARQAQQGDRADAVAS